jgi:hypothetical protein
LPAPGPEAQPVLDEEAWQEVEVVVVQRQGKGIRKETSLLLLSLLRIQHILIFEEFLKSTSYTNKHSKALN